MNSESLSELIEISLEATEFFTRSLVGGFARSRACKSKNERLARLKIKGRAFRK
jgi:hypothetical protein